MLNGLIESGEVTGVVDKKEDRLSGGGGVRGGMIGVVTREE